MSSTSSINPKWGEIWLVGLDPTEGSEIDKKRPAVVISSDGVGQIPIKLVVANHRLEGSLQPEYLARKDYA